MSLKTKKNNFFYVRYTLNRLNLSSAGTYKNLNLRHIHISKGIFLRKKNRSFLYEEHVVLFNHFKRSPYFFKKVSNFKFKDFVTDWINKYNSIQGKIIYLDQFNEINTQKLFKSTPLPSNKKKLKDDFLLDVIKTYFGKYLTKDEMEVLNVTIWSGFLFSLLKFLLRKRKKKFLLILYVKWKYVFMTSLSKSNVFRDLQTKYALSKSVSMSWFYFDCFVDAVTQGLCKILKIGVKFTKCTKQTARNIIKFYPQNLFFKKLIIGQSKLYCTRPEYTDRNAFFNNIFCQKTNNVLFQPYSYFYKAPWGLPPKGFDSKKFLFSLQKQPQVVEVELTTFWQNIFLNILDVNFNTQPNTKISINKSEREIRLWNAYLLSNWQIFHYYLLIQFKGFKYQSIRFDDRGRFYFSLLTGLNKMYRPIFIAGSEKPLR